MARKRLTQAFPFLLPLRQRQRRFFFYTGMKLDKNKYASELHAETLPHLIYNDGFELINEESGYDIIYQQNKVHNTKLIAATMEGLLIRPGEVFSFWHLARHADKHIPYKDGLALVNGKIITKPGGGVCQNSNLLFWIFLHSPLTVIERHSHAIKDFPTRGIPIGADATVNEGWNDLKVQNNTDTTYQLRFGFDEAIHCYLYADRQPAYRYEVESRDVEYLQRGHEYFEKASVYQKHIPLDSRGMASERLLHEDCCKIGFEPPAGSRVIRLYE